MDDDIFEQQAYASASHLHRLHVHYDLETLRARSYLHMLRLLFLPDRTEKKHLQRARRVVGYKLRSPSGAWATASSSPSSSTLCGSTISPECLSTCSPSADLAGRLYARRTCQAKRSYDQRALREPQRSIFSWTSPLPSTSP